MANIRSSKKSIRKTARRTEVNRNNRSQMRTAIKRLDTAIKQENANLATQLFQRTESIIASSVTKGVIHKNTAARLTSRLNKAVKKLNTQAA